jgi:crotonobetainyl-CoA:carnitine CoA-transferase CaiB-like acyl-CoA transferase
MSVADTNAGLHGLVALLSALWMRERTGLGQHIDMAMIDAMLVTDDGLHFDLEDSWATKLLPSDVWETAIGPVLLSADFRHIWKMLTSMFGVEDPMKPGAGLKEKAEARRAVARSWFRTVPDEASLVAALDTMNLAWGRVRKASEVREQPTVRHRRSIVEVDDRAGGTRPIVQAPYRFSGATSGVRGPAPWQGEHNDEVLREWLGLGLDGMQAWRGVLVSQQIPS